MATAAICRWPGPTTDDLLAGGLGADQFRFEAAGGSDTISDFSIEEDDVIVVVAGLNGTGIVSAADLLARIADNVDGDAVIDLGAGDLMTLTESRPPPSRAPAS